LDNLIVAPVLPNVHKKKTFTIYGLFPTKKHATAAPITDAAVDYTPI
jgi:hypothetical protein